MRQKKLLIVMVVVCLGLMVTVLPSGKKAHAKVITLKVANFFPAKAFQHQSMPV